MSSEWVASVPLVLGVAAVASVITSRLLAVRSRRERSRGRTLAIAGTAGLALAFTGLVLSSFRHYGGDAAVGDGPTAYACGAWWQEEANPSGVDDVLGSTPSCQQAATDAIVPALGWSSLFGLAGAGATYGVLRLSRRQRRTPAGSPVRVISA